MSTFVSCVFKEMYAKDPIAIIRSMLTTIAIFFKSIYIPLFVVN